MGNKLREMFEPNSEQEARIKQMFDELAKQHGCTTCKNCVEDPQKVYYPAFVTLERCKCQKGLYCDTVLYSIRNCIEYKYGWKNRRVNT